MARNIHVVPTAGNGWTIETEDAGRSNVLFPSQEEAIKTASAMAKRTQVELIIHGRDGQIRECNSIGNDPRDIKG